jgi:histidyl-tRNA synthetase
VTIAAGGRYDGLIGMFQSGDVPATGGSLGIERILLLLEQQAAADEALDAPDVVVTVLEDPASDAAGAAGAVALAQRLRTHGFAVDLEVGGGKLGKQLKRADRRGARTAVIRGADERAAGTVAVKDLRSGDQTTVAEGDLTSHLAAILGR